MVIKMKTLVLLFLILSLIGINFLTRSACVYGFMEKGSEMKIREESEPSLVNESNSNGNSSEKSWHTIAAWKFNIPTIAAFSLVGFLRLLSDSSDKIDDLNRVFTIETVHNIRLKICKKIRKLRKKTLDIVYEVIGGRRFRSYKEKRKSYS